MIHNTHNGTCFNLYHESSPLSHTVDMLAQSYELKGWYAVQVIILQKLQIITLNGYVLMIRMFQSEFHFN